MRPSTIEQIERMKTQTLGVEVEMTGLTREKAARVIGTYFNTIPYHYGRSYDEWHVSDQQGRTWKIVYDSSIITRRGQQVELVTPILTYEDMETLQEIIRILRRNGGISYPSLQCGIHIHIGADGHDARTLRNLTNIMASHEDILSKAIGITSDRRGYCRTTSDRFLKEVNKKKPKTMDELERIWYNGPTERYMHYSPSRYHMLNLHATFSKGTVEFRCFNFVERTTERKGGLHAGLLKSYIQLCLAMSQQAKDLKYASPTKVQMENERYSLRTWMLRLGLIGDEFKTARDMLMRNLTGNSAWRHTSPKKDKDEPAA